MSALTGDFEAHRTIMLQNDALHDQSSFHNASASRSVGSFQRKRNNDAKDREGRSTALHVAVSGLREREVRRLLAEDVGAVCEADSSGATPLHYAVGVRAPEPIVKLLLVASATPLAVDTNGVR